MKKNFRMISILLSVTLFTVLLTVCTFALSSTVYVDADSGSDSYAGTSTGAPYATLTKAYLNVADGGTIIICSDMTLPASSLRVASGVTSVKLTSSYGSVITLSGNVNFFCNSEISNLGFKTETSSATWYLVFRSFDTVIGSDVFCIKNGNMLPSLLAGVTSVTSSSTYTSPSLTVNGGSWYQARFGTGGNVSQTAAYNSVGIINGGVFMGKVIIGGNSGMTNSSSSASLTVNGGELRAGVYGNGDFNFAGTITLTVNGGTIYDTIAPATSDVALSGRFNVNINGGNMTKLCEIIGTEDFTNSTMTSTLTVGNNFDAYSENVGTYSFTNYLRAGADPCMFYYDGYYYLTCTGTSKIMTYRTRNIGDLKDVVQSGVAVESYFFNGSLTDVSTVSGIWSPEIHYFSSDEVGAANAGWYLYVALNTNDNTGGGSVNVHMYAMKSVTGKPEGPYGHPTDGTLNKPQRILYDETKNGNAAAYSPWSCGQSVVKINDKIYFLWVGEENRGTANFYQTDNIAEMINPWTFGGNIGVIITPDQEWEYGGAGYSYGTYYPKVVEGATAVYGENGEVYLVYSGSGYWTPEYALGQMTYTGGANGDPTDPDNWAKYSGNPILSKNNTVCGTGHASFFTDAQGTDWASYHAYVGDNNTDSGRFVFVEPYTIENGIVKIGNKSGYPAALSATYTRNISPVPFVQKVSAFSSTTLLNPDTTPAVEAGTLEKVLLNGVDITNSVIVSSGFITINRSLLTGVSHALIEVFASGGDNVYVYDGSGYAKLNGLTNALSKGGVSVRTDSSADGLRFAFGLKNSALTDTGIIVDEYGILVDTTGSSEPTYIINSLDYINLVAKSRAYSRTAGINHIYGTTADSVLFSGVVTEIPAEIYETVMTARAYLKFTVDGHQYVIYSEAENSSLAAAASSTYG